MSCHPRTPPSDRRVDQPNDRQLPANAPPSADDSSSSAGMQVSLDWPLLGGRRPSQELIDEFLADETLVAPLDPPIEFFSKWQVSKALEHAAIFAMGRAILRMLQPPPVAEIDALVAWCVRVKARLHAA